MGYGFNPECDHLVGGWESQVDCAIAFTDFSAVGGEPARRLGLYQFGVHQGDSCHQDGDCAGIIAKGDWDVVDRKGARVGVGSYGHRAETNRRNDGGEEELVGDSGGSGYTWDRQEDDISSLGKVSDAEMDDCLRHT